MREGKGGSVAWCSVQGFAWWLERASAIWLGDLVAYVHLCMAVVLSRGNKTFCPALCRHGYMCVLLGLCGFLYDPQSELNHCVFKLYKRTIQSWVSHLRWDFAFRFHFAMTLDRNCFPFLFFKQKGVQTLKLGLGSYTVVFRNNINQQVSKVTK